MGKVLKIIGGIVLGIIILCVVILVITSLTSKKMKCTSSEGKITIMYNKKTITGYTASGMSYDLDEQKEYANQIGIEEYLDEFATWFENNTSGTCNR